MKIRRINRTGAFPKAVISSSAQITSTTLRQVILRCDVKATPVVISNVEDLS